MLLSNNNKIGVLVASPTIAKLYIYSKMKNPLELLASKQHEASRKKVTDLIANDKTAYQKSFSYNQGTYEPPTNAKKNEAQRFAEQLSDILNEHSNSFSSLIVFAPAHFQSLIKNKVSNSVKSKIKCFIDKDYTKQKDDKIKSYVVKAKKPF